MVNIMVINKKFILGVLMVSGVTQCKYDALQDDERSTWVLSSASEAFTPNSLITEEAAGVAADDSSFDFTSDSSDMFRALPK
jgi:hypothetical protein